MPVIRGREGERTAILEATRLMLISARTAPKSGGVDDVLTAIVYGKEKRDLVAEMKRIAEQRNSHGFRRDAENVEDSEAVMLFGVRGRKSLGLDCGACGYASCQKFEKEENKVEQDFTGPTCLFKTLDLGIALGSAAKTASILNVDNRIMYRVGVAARRLDLLPEADIIMGAPLSATGKNIYFDRPKRQ